MTHPNPIGIISDEVSQDLEDVIRFAKEFSLDGIELRSVEGKAFKDLTEADVGAVGRRLSDSGLAVAGVATPVFKCELEDSAEIGRHRDLFKRSLEHARRLNCKIVRVFAFLRKGPSTSRDHLKQAAEHFHVLLEAVDGDDLTIGVENEATTLACTGEEMAVFLDELPDPRIGVVWDPCNILFLPGRGQPAREDYSLLADRVRHVHVKDARRENGRATEHCVELGTGDLDFASQFQQLKERDYRGWITLETHWRMQPLTAEQAHLPAGHAFSANAEEPSRICMKQLLALLRPQ